MDLLRRIKPYSIYLILGLILVLGATIRLYALSEHPLWIDESISSLAAEKILEKGIPQFDSGIFYSRALIFHYSQALSLLFFHNDFGARLPSVIIGLLTILLAFYIGKEFDTPTGLIAATFTSFLFLEVIYSRQARFYQLFQLLFFLTLYCLYKSKDKRYAWAASISMILAIQTQIAGIILAPILLLTFFFEQKDKKLLIIPSLAILYYLASTLSIFSVSGTSLASTYFEDYSFELFNQLRAFAVFSIIGLFIAYKSNKRLFYNLLIPTIILYAGLMFVKLFAIRYVYFTLFSLIIFSSLIFSSLYKKNKILGIVVLLFALIYSSNLVQEHGYLTVLKPTPLMLYTPTEPVIDYKHLSSSTQELISQSDLVTLWTPGVNWYFHKPLYSIPFSLNGLPSGYANSTGVDSYTGVPAFNNQIDSFVLFADAFGYGKLNSKERESFDNLTSSCKLLDSLPTLRVYNCQL